MMCRISRFVLRASCVAFCVAVSLPVLATVCRTEPELQEAVAGVGTSGEICIVEGTYDLTATLVLPVKSGVIIRGVKDDGTTPADRTKVVLNAGGDKRVLTSTQSGFVLRDLTVSNGYFTATAVDADCGGGIYAANASLFSNCVFTCNHLGGVSNGGGGLGLMASGNTVIRDCLFEENVSEATGGAFHTQQASSGPKIYDTVFRNNTSKGNGGAISTRNSGVLAGLYGCTFENNQASGNDGAVYAACLPIISNCTFRGNSAAGAGALGTDRNGLCSVYDTCFLTNSALSGTGGAISTATTGQGRNDYSFYNCTFDGNTAKTTGGAVHMGAGKNNSKPYNATIRYATNTVFRGNRCSNNGGALYGSIQRMVDCKFIDNEQKGGSGSYGGAFYYASDPGNTEYAECPPVFERTEFINNRSSGNRNNNNSGGAHGDGGGAVYANSSTAQLAFKGCNFLYNSTTNCVSTNYNHYTHGGCIFSRGYIAAEDCLFKGNAGYTFGGTIYAFGVTGGLRRCTFANNYMRHPKGFGAFYNIARGTVYIDAGSAGKTNVVEDCVFTNNVVCGGAGGGLMVRNGILELRGCTFVDNLNSKDTNDGTGGSAVNLEAAVTARIDRCAFVRNRTEHYDSANGGGLCFSGTGYVRNSLFMDNLVTNFNQSSTSGSGGGVYAANNPMEFTNNTFVRNRAGNYVGGGLRLMGFAGVTNCVFFGNSYTVTKSGQTHSSPYDEWYAGDPTRAMNCRSTTAQNNVLKDGVNGCVVSPDDPFCSDDHCDLALKKDCGRGAGFAEIDWLKAAGSLDLGGKPRTTKTDGVVTVDMGCYQRWMKPGLLMFVW